VHLLQETRAALNAYSLYFFYLVHRIKIYGLVPDEQDRDVGDLLRKKLPKKIQEAPLPGNVRGAGIEIVGSTDRYRYSATIASYLPEPTSLYLEAELSFVPNPGDVDHDVDVVGDDLQMAYDLLTTEVVASAREFLP
jgi:hypothetical protein